MKKKRPVTKEQVLRDALKAIKKMTVLALMVK